MTWQEIEHRLHLEIRPGSSSILKADGRERRTVTSNRGRRIGMRTGVTTKQTKAIDYDMIRDAFETLMLRGRFDSADFRRRFRRAYDAAPCRFSMTGGVLVELGLASLEPAERGEEAVYIRSPEVAEC